MAAKKGGLALRGVDVQAGRVENGLRPTGRRAVASPSRQRGVTAFCCEPDVLRPARGTTLPSGRRCCRHVRVQFSCRHLIVATFPFSAILLSPLLPGSIPVPGQRQASPTAHDVLRRFPSLYCPADGESRAPNDKANLGPNACPFHAFRKMAFGQYPIACAPPPHSVATFRGSQRGCSAALPPPLPWGCARVCAQRCRANLPTARPRPFGGKWAIHPRQAALPSPKVVSRRPLQYPSATKDRQINVLK